MNLRPAEAHRLVEAERHSAPIARQKATRKEHYSGRSWSTHCNKPNWAAAHHRRVSAHCPTTNSAVNGKTDLWNDVFLEAYNRSLAACVPPFECLSSVRSGSSAPRSHRHKAVLSLAANYPVEQMVRLNHPLFRGKRQEQSYLLRRIAC